MTPGRLRIVGGAWRGRALTTPAGLTTRPTAERVRQALFDMLLHAPWSPWSPWTAGGLAGAVVLDAFAGSGALGLEALSRGADHATFLDTDRAARTAIAANIAACRADDRARLLPADATAPPAAPTPCTLVFLDPPYASDLLARALPALRARGWLAPGALLVAETARDAQPPAGEVLAERAHGAARLWVWRGTAVSS